jgi:hypothetical protein
MATHHTLLADYNEVLRKFDETYPTQHPRPVGWYKFLDLGGKQHGFGFHCEKCHLIVEPNAPEEIRHCGGKIEKFPGWLKRITNMASYRVPKKLLLL